MKIALNSYQDVIQFMKDTKRKKCENCEEKTYHNLRGGEELGTLRWGCLKCNGF